MKLTATRVEDVPIVELSSLALVEGEQAYLLAIGDKHARLARAVVSGGTLDWTVVELGRHGADEGDAQFEGIAAAGDGTVLVLSEDPPVVTMLDADGELAERTTLAAGDRGAGVFEQSSSAGEGLLPLRGGRLLVAKEKDPPLLVEFGPPGAAATGVAAGSFPDPGDPLGMLGPRLQALAAWRIDDVGDVSDIAYRHGSLYCLSDQSRCVVVIELPLDPDSGRSQIGDRWELRVPERRGEPDGKPEGLVVMDDGTFIVGLDTKSPRANLCWYQP